MRDSRVWPACVVVAIACAGVSIRAAAQAAPPASTAQGLQLLHRMQDALGGAERIAAIRDFEETVDARTWNPDGTPLGHVRKRTRWMRDPNVIRLDQVGPRDTYVLFYDGSASSGWEILPDRGGSDPLRTTGKAIDLAGGELRFAQSYLSGFQFNQWLADRVAGFTVSSPAPNVLRIAHGDNADDFTLDSTTALPLKSSGISLANPDPSSSQRDALRSVDHRRRCSLSDTARQLSRGTQAGRDHRIGYSNQHRAFARAARASTFRLHARRPSALGSQAGSSPPVSTHAHRRSATSSDRTVSVHTPARPSRDAHRRADPG